MIINVEDASFGVFHDWQVDRLAHEYEQEVGRDLSLAASHSAMGSSGRFLVDEFYT